MFGLGWLMLGALPVLAGSGDWFARAWRSEDGLPDNNVSGVVQSPDGYLWVGTYGGLMRFDGARFQEFPPDNLPGLPGRGVRALVLDQRKRLWLGLDRGYVVCLESGAARVFTEKDELPAIQIVSMTEDGEGAIWIYNARGNLVRIKDGKVGVFASEEGVPSGGVPCSVTRDNEGRLWFAKSGRVSVFRDERFQRLLNLPEQKAALGRAGTGGVWICAGARLLKCDPTGRIEERGLLPAEVTPSVVFEDRLGAVWIGTTTKGLFRYDAAGIESVATSHREISCLSEDGEGNLWVGTGGGGLNRLRRRTVELVGAEAGLPVESVRSVCEDATGAVWLAAQSGALVRGQGNRWTVMSDTTNWPGGRAICVAGASSGTVWVGTDRGLVRWEDGKFQLMHRRSEFVRSLLVDSRGDVWMVLASRLQRLRGGSFKNFELPPQVRSLRAMTEDAAGNIWLGSSEGRLLRVSDEVVVDETLRVQRELRSIRSLHATPDGSLWIGYAGMGLGRLKGGEYRRITREQGLADNYVSQIVADRSGWLWMAGKYGIFQMSMREVTEVIEGRASLVRPMVYGPGEGVPNLQATFENTPSVWRARSGQLWVATRTGLAVIHPENVLENPNPPPVWLERVVVDGQTVGLRDSHFPLGERGTNVLELRSPATVLRLRPDHRRLEFDFSALSFTAPENVQFRYRLEGLDEGWSPDSAERSAPYSRLPAGDYRFRVMACNNAGVWNEAGAALNVTVLPFFWQTWWFRLAGLGGVTLSVIAIVRYVSFRRLRLRLQLLEQQTALEKERTRIARDLHDDLGGSLTEAALLLEMTQNRSPASGEVAARLRQCASLVRQVACSVDEIIWAINPRNDTLRYLIDYTSQFAVEFLHAAGLRCSVDLPDKLSERPVSPEVRHHLFLVVKEALNNIAQHAQAGEVSLRVTAENGEVVISIQDDGRGFAHVPDNSRSDGLRNMRHRMEEIGGRFILESKPGSGTRVEFVYPWPRRKGDGLKLNSEIELPQKNTKNAKPGVTE